MSFRSQVYYRSTSTDLCDLSLTEELLWSILQGLPALLHSFSDLPAISSDFPAGSIPMESTNHPMIFASFKAKARCEKIHRAFGTRSSWPSSWSSPQSHWKRAKSLGVLQKNVWFHFGHGIFGICGPNIPQRQEVFLVSAFWAADGCVGQVRIWTSRRSHVKDALRGTIFVSRNCGLKNRSTAVHHNLSQLGGIPKLWTWVSLWTPGPHTTSSHKFTRTCPSAPKIQWFAYVATTGQKDSKLPADFFGCHILERCHAAAQPVDNCLVKKILYPSGHFCCHVWLPDFAIPTANFPLPASITKE